MEAAGHISWVAVAKVDSGLGLNAMALNRTNGSINPKVSGSKSIIWSTL